MNIYFSGIGGVGLGALAELAQDAGHQVQGSDSSESLVTKELGTRGIVVSLKQKGAFLQAVHHIQPIDWFVYSAAIPEDHPELSLARQLGIKISKRDELLSYIIKEKNLKLLAIAGTHGKTTTTSMLIWALRQLAIPVSYSVGTTISFGSSGQYDPKSEYFVYECDEFDRNFLNFHPYAAIITSIDYDHPDTYGTPEAYMQSFRQFMDQSEHTIMWHNDGLLVNASENDGWIISQDDIAPLTLAGEHNRRNATLVMKLLEKLAVSGDAATALNSFPGSSRRFEEIAPNLYSDYGHHPTEIAATLQMARELNEHVVLIYQPHQNTRQHEIRSQYVDCFELADDIYWLPTYLTRENPSLPILSPQELIENITNIDHVHIVTPEDDLWGFIQKARAAGKLVLVMGAGSIDSWLRDKVNTPQFINILLLDDEGNYLMQPSPGTENNVATIHGEVDQDKDISLAAAAMRILKEVTGLEIDDQNLQYFQTYPRTMEMHGEKSLITYFTLTHAPTDTKLASDSTPLAKVNPNTLHDYNLGVLDRSVIVEFSHPAPVGEPSQN